MLTERSAAYLQGRLFEEGITATDEGVESTLNLPCGYVCDNERLIEGEQKILIWRKK